MPSRLLLSSSSQTHKPNLLTKTKFIFLILTISSSLLIIFSLLYFFYHLWSSLIQNHAKTIPFDAPIHKLHRFTYKQLKLATNNFDEAYVIGKGGSGTVFRGSGQNGKLFAVKRVDSVSVKTEREFQNELQILGGLRSEFLVSLLGYCIEKKDYKFLVYDYMPNKSLQESLFNGVLDWSSRFDIIIDVVKAIEFLHCGCDPPVIHGDIKPSNILLDSSFRARVSDFGLSRVKVEGEFGVDLGFSQDLGKSQELATGITTPVEDKESCQEVDFALALQLQASTSSKNSRSCYNVKALNLNSVSYNADIANESEVKAGNGNGKGKEVFSENIPGYDKFSSFDDESCSVEHSKELNGNPGATGSKQWGKDWWWMQDGSGELCSKDYVTEWIGSQICPPSNPDWGEEKKTPKIASENLSGLDNPEDGQLQDLDAYENLDEELEKKEKNTKNRKKKHRKMQEWWREERLDEISKKRRSKFKRLETKWKKGFKIRHFDLRRKKFGEQNKNECDENGEFSFRKGWRKKRNNNSIGSDMWSGDLFSRELSSTTSMRGTLCYVAPECGGFSSYLMEKTDIYSLGVLILVIVSGRRPLHVLASPIKLEKANLISWCRQLAQSGNILELVDEKLKDKYNKEQASMCINLALICLQKMPELRPEIGEILRVLRGKIEVPPLPFEFSPSPPTKSCSRYWRKQRIDAD
ncbi:hypothetical protein ACFE04_031713 [Oxalis oulophora]